MRQNLLRSNGRITMVNDILDANHQSSNYQSNQILSDAFQQTTVASVQTGCYQVAVQLAIELVNLESQRELDAQSIRYSLDRVESILSQSLIYYNVNGYFMQQPNQSGSLFLTAFLVDLIVQLKQNAFTREICTYTYEQVERSLYWISKQSINLFGNLPNLIRNLNRETKSNESSPELFSRLTTLSQVLITVCNAKFTMNQSDSNLDNKFDTFRPDNNLLDLINQTISNHTKLFAHVELSKLNNEFSSLIVYSLSKCRNDLFKKFYFDLIRFYSKRLDNQNYYISLNRIYTQHPFVRDGMRNELSFKHKHHNESNPVSHSSQYSIRPRTFDSSDTLAM